MVRSWRFLKSVGALWSLRKVNLDGFGCKGISFAGPLSIVNFSDSTISSLLLPAGWIFTNPSLLPADISLFPFELLSRGGGGGGGSGGGGGGGGRPVF